MQFEQLRSASSYVQTSRNHLTNLVQIGRGSYGTVYTAKHVDWGTVAYKCLNVRDKFVDSSCIEKVKKEIQAHSKLHHPNITQMLGIVSEPDFELGIVLKYEQYGNAFNFIHKFQVDWPWKVEMMYGTALGLNYLHTSNPPLIHGDIKIHNVLIGDDFVAKLSDFGLSKWRDYTTSRTSVYPRGTLTHIAPERFRNIHAKRNEMFDVYSYGILVWELLTGNLPFADNPDSLIIEAVKSGYRPDVSEIAANVPPPVREAMEQCWADQPDNRPNSRAITRTMETLRALYRQQIEKCRYDLRIKRSEVESAPKISRLKIHLTQHYDSRRRMSGCCDPSSERLPIETESRGSCNSPGVAIPQRSGRTNPSGPTEVSDSSSSGSNAPIQPDYNNSQLNRWRGGRNERPNAFHETSARGGWARYSTPVGLAARLPASTPSVGMPSPGIGAYQFSAARTVLNSTATISSNLPTLATAGAAAPGNARPQSIFVTAQTNAGSWPSSAAAAERRSSTDEDVPFTGSQIAVSAGDDSHSEMERTKKNMQRKAEPAEYFGLLTNSRLNARYGRDHSAALFFVSDMLTEVDRSIVVGNTLPNRSDQLVDNLADDSELGTVTQPSPTSPDATIAHSTGRFNAQQHRQQQFDGDPALHY